MPSLCDARMSMSMSMLDNTRTGRVRLRPHEHADFVDPCDLSRGGCPSAVAVITRGGTDRPAERRPMRREARTRGPMGRVSSMVDRFGSVEPCPVGLHAQWC